jgi:cbb3-type cytochrome oxidase cytochrome c subunit
VSRVRADRRVGLMLGAVLLLTFVAIGATVALPASDPSLRAKQQNTLMLRKHGMRVYQSEGCWYCHTQYQRSTKSDTGEKTTAAAFVGDSPAMLGLERVGPDLRGLSTSDVIAYLHKAHGSMPSYAYLSDKDLVALAAYLQSLH